MLVINFNATLVSLTTLIIITRTSRIYNVWLVTFMYSDSFFSKWNIIYFFHLYFVLDEAEDQLYYLSFCDASEFLFRVKPGFSSWAFNTVDENDFMIKIMASYNLLWNLVIDVYCLIIDGVYEKYQSI